MNIARLDWQACETGLVPQAKQSYQNTCRKQGALQIRGGGEVEGNRNLNFLKKKKKVKPKHYQPRTQAH